METEILVNQLINLYREKKMAHAYLVETNNINKCFNDIIKVIKGICCNDKYIENCTKCNICHLIEQNSLPSLIIIEPDGKNIKKEAIENLKSSFSTKSAYTENNIYIIKYPEKMNDTAFNKMLKFLEEPEDNIIGFYLTENKDNVANTIVSRCEILKFNYLNNNKSDILGLTTDEYDRFKNLAKIYKSMLDENNSTIIWYNNSVLAKELQNRNEIIVFLRILFDLYDEQIDENVNSKTILYKKISILSKYLEQLNYNVNTTLLLDSLAIEIGEAHEK